MIADEEVQAALADLGNTADAVAATLTKLGIKGTRSATCCPVSNYLKSKFAGHDVATDDQAIIIENATPPLNFIVIDPPRAIRAFVRRFDNTTKYNHLFLKGAKP